MNKRLVKVLSTVSALLVLSTLVVPVFAYKSDDSYAGRNFHLIDVVGMPAGLLYAMGVGALLTLTVLAWLERVNRWWGIGALLAAFALTVSFVGTTSMGGYCWDGVDAQGRPIGNCDSARRAIGFWLDQAGAGVIGVAGIIALVKVRRP